METNAQSRRRLVRAWRTSARGLRELPHAPGRCRPASRRRLYPRAEIPDQRADHARADHRDPPDGPGAASQVAFSAVSMLAASTARDSGMSSGTGTTASTGTSNWVWWGYSANTLRPTSVGRPGLDRADRGITVFHRKREFAAHERRAHALVFALRHPAGRDQRLGAPADRAICARTRTLPSAKRRQAVSGRISACARPHVPKRLRHLLAARHAPPRWTESPAAGYILHGPRG